MGNLLSPSIYDMLLSLNKLPFFYGAEHAGTPKGRTIAEPHGRTPRRSPPPGDRMDR